MVQWLGLRAFTTEGTDLITGQGTKILQDLQPKKKKEKKRKKEML